MRLYKSKKGIDFVVVVILSLITLIILGGLVYKYYKTSKEKLEVQNCKGSIEAHDFMSTTTVREIFTDIKCPTRSIVFGNSKDNEIKTAIAMDMQRCWYEWGKGEGEYFPGDGTFCHICSIYSFKDTNRQIPGFLKYLSTETIHLKYVGDTPGMTYLQYFGLGKKDAEAVSNVQDPQLIKGDYIDTSQKYATIFVYSSKKEDIQKILEGRRAATFASGGIAIEAGTAAGIGGVLGAIALGSNPIGWAVTAGTFVTLGGVALYEALHVEPPKKASFIKFAPYTADEIEGIPCQRLEVNQLSHREP
jgi:hypothetical protein